MNLSLRQEADFIEDLARRDHPGAIARLDVLLDRCKRLEGNDLTTAQSFNARLVTELRHREVKLFTTYEPPAVSHGRGLPMSGVE